MGDFAIPGIGSIDSLVKKWEDFLKTQPPAVEVLITGLQSSAQGAFIGYMLGSLSKMDPGAAAGGAPNPAFAALQTAGPFQQAKNLATLTGVNAAANLAIKKARGGKEDVYGAMGASFCSGVAYSLVSGAPNPIQAAVSTGCAFALFNGLFYQLGQMFKPEHPDTEYQRGSYMLKCLGLNKYADNLRKGLLTDQTIMLWNSDALKDCGVPAGPRLLILHHLDTYRNPSHVLKPALPLPPLPPAPAGIAPAAQVPAAAAAGRS